MKRVLFIVAGLLGSCFFTGCSGTAVQRAAEIRVVFKQVQFEQAELCSRPTANEEKCAEFKQLLDNVSPWIDKIELLAPLADQNPLDAANFEILWAQYRPEVEKILISIFIEQYLGP